RTEFIMWMVNIEAARQAFIWNQRSRMRSDINGFIIWSETISWMTPGWMSRWRSSPPSNIIWTNMARMPQAVFAIRCLDAGKESNFLKFPLAYQLQSIQGLSTAQSSMDAVLCFLRH